MKKLQGKKVALFMLPLLTQGGGAEKYFIDLARNFRERGVKADVVTMDEKFFARFAKLLYLFAYRRWFRYIDISGREKKSAVREQLGEACWIKTDFNNLKNILREYDIVYSKNELVDLALLKFIGFKRLPPVVVGMHTPLFFLNAKKFITKLHNFLYLGFFYRWLLRDVKCIHVSNKFTKNIVSKKFKVRSELIYYPFSVEKNQQVAEENKSRINFSRDKINIIFAGRFSEQKGFDTLLGLIEKLGADDELRNKIRLNVFGSGGLEEREIIENLATKFDFVRCFGHIENRFMPDILRHQDLMIAPSRWETLPYAILEAQAMGVPVIALDIPGPTDIIEDGKTGFLVKSEGNFFEKIKEIIEDKVIFDKNYIVKNIKDKFDPEKIHRELINMFEEILCEN